MDTTQTYYHGSPAVIDSIKPIGVFDGVFASVAADAALSHGDVLHVIESPRPLSDYELNYEVQGAWDAAVQVCRGDESKAEVIMQAACPYDGGDAEEGWELQRLRGRLAARLGYTSIEMHDEHGTTWLCLPGCSIRQAQA